jgi:hypothetical protein
MANFLNLFRAEPLAFNVDHYRIYLSYSRRSKMKPSDILNQPWYDPNNLFDTLIARMGLRSDASLSRVLNMPASLISNMRRRRIAVGLAILVRIHEVTGLSIKELRLLTGDERESFFEDFHLD